MDWEPLSSWLFCLASLILCLSEIYFAIRSSKGSSFLSLPMVTLSKCHQILDDFYNGKFYRPWAPEPILVEPTKKKMTELSEAPVLSQRAVYADMFSFKHTIKVAHQYEIKTMRTRSRLYSLILNVRGPAQLAKLHPYIQNRLERFLDNELSPVRVEPDGSLCLPLAQTCRVMASRMMGVIFFGEELMSDPAFSKAVYDHPQQTVRCMALFQLMPRVMSPLIHSIVTRHDAAMKLILRRLIPVIDSETKNWSEPAGLKELTLLDIFTKETHPTRDYWTPETLIQALMGLLLAASHQPWVNLYIFLYRLCENPEWQDILREEIRAAKTTQPLDYHRLDQLPLLDSFMRETARLVSLDKLNIRRKALQDYTFSDRSPHVPAGATVCVSSYDASHNAATYPDPEAFDGRRFVDGNHNDSTHQYSDVSEHYLIWGYGSLACPGRFHATFVLKLALINLLLRYDIRLDDPKMRSHWMYEAFSMPYESTKVVLTPRGTA
ncbi:putative cytochrome P450 [Aspergillus sclerotioniger CBS 115572]|uniref:Putative cytochrome P450 n=1 Tax=Aspergillus sclerotioniger CBS 115572 TaxID=1450535 RepID=A0A317X3T1_9EURO|nr:putative cytochrome P450 [Aspergillus sclerotioniger CBS 115572]PWY93005.1 putative cytochrome P450 [Aspergillus sclerotioniger CBS 115572]